jgi:shikimate kinase
MEKRATVYFEPDLHRALRLKAVETDKSISQIVNEAVREILAEDADDLEAFDKRESEANLDFADVLRDLRKRGRL